MLLRLMINYVRSDFSKSFPIKALQSSGSDQADCRLALKYINRILLYNTFI